VFSANVSVNAAIPENQERAYLVRLRDAMNDEGVPEEIQGRIREYVEADAHPGARTLALFAAEDGLFEVYRLQVDVPRERAEHEREGELLAEIRESGVSGPDETIAALTRF
jgi:hypothetical protein